MKGKLRRLLAAPALVGGLACGDGRDAETAGSAPDTSSSATAEAPMPAMSGMASEGMITDMESHLRAMEGANPDSLVTRLPEHRQKVANLLAQMNREMRDMNMKAEATWDATVDSVRQDLVRMPEMTPSELKGLMPAHGARVRRLAALHRGMMQLPR